jgi:hypothetical protein
LRLQAFSVHINATRARTSLPGACYIYCTTCDHPRTTQPRQARTQNIRGTSSCNLIEQQPADGFGGCSFRCSPRVARTGVRRRTGTARRLGPVPAPGHLRGRPEDRNAGRRVPVQAGLAHGGRRLLLPRHRGRGQHAQPVRRQLHARHGVHVPGPQHAGPLHHARRPGHRRSQPAALAPARLGARHGPQGRGHGGVHHERQPALLQGGPGERALRHPPWATAFPA